MELSWLACVIASWMRPKHQTRGGPEALESGHRNVSVQALSQHLSAGYGRGTFGSDGRVLLSPRDRSRRKPAPWSHHHVRSRLSRHPGNCLCSRRIHQQADPARGASRHGSRWLRDPGRALDLDKAFHSGDGFSASHRCCAGVGGDDCCGYEKRSPTSGIPFCRDRRGSRTTHPWRGVGYQHRTDLRLGW